MDSRHRKLDTDELQFEELNLVEIPIGVLADRVPNGKKTLELADSIHDKASGRRVHRQWIITGADKWGLPHGNDTDVFLALGRMCVRQGAHWRDGVVKFSLYELLQELNWPHDGRYNKRLKAALDRLFGVSIECINSWRKSGEWRSIDSFHLLDNVRLTNTVARFDPEEEQRIKLNEVVVESMQAGHVKGLDWELYLQLESSVTKRLYRFLDKRWELGSQWKYAVIPFCENKMGMYQVRKTNYRKSLQVGIEELVSKGILAKLPDEKQFTGRGRNSWVHFVKARKRRAQRVNDVEPQASATPSETETKLIASGVEAGRRTRTCAGSLVESYSSEKIDRCIEHWKAENRQAKRGEEKSVGYLIASITSENERGFVPEVYKTTEEQVSERKEKARKRAMKQQAEKQELEQQRLREAKQWNAFETCRNSYSEEERQRLEDAALAELDCNDMMRMQVLKARRQGEVGMFHQLLWEQHIMPSVNEMSIGGSQ